VVTTILSTKTKNRNEVVVYQLFPSFKDTIHWVLQALRLLIQSAI